MNQIQSALGSGFSALGSVMPSFLGGPQIAQFGQNMIPANPDIISSALGTTTDPSLNPYFTGGTDPSTATGTTASGVPGAPTGTMTSDPAFALPMASALNPFAGPASSTEAAFTGLPGTTEPVTGGPLGPALGDPASSMTASVLAALGLTGGGGTAGTAAAGGRSPLAGDLGILAAGGTDLLKYLQQRSLTDPNAIAAATQQMMNKNAKALRKSILPQVTAQAQETGQINAPYLMDQAYTTAIAPTLANEQMAAMEDWLRANAVATGLYPGASDIGALGGFVSPNIFGGGVGTA